MTTERARLFLIIALLCAAVALAGWLLPFLSPDDFSRSLSVELIGVAVEMFVVLIGVAWLVESREARAAAVRNQKLIERLKRVEPNLARGFERELSDFIENLREPALISGQDDFDNERRVAFDKLNFLRQRKNDYHNLLVSLPGDLAPKTFDEVLAKADIVSDVCDSLIRVVEIVYSSEVFYQHFQAGNVPIALRVDNLTAALGELEKRLGSLKCFSSLALAPIDPEVAEDIAHDLFAIRDRLDRKDE